MKGLWHKFTLTGVCLYLAACGTAEPMHVSSLHELPAQDEFVAEYTGRDAMNFWSLSGSREFVWDLPIDPTLGKIQSNGLRRLAWSSGAHKFFLAASSSAYLISTDGVANQLDLRMPGTLLPFDGMETYSISPDGSLIAYYLRTRRDSGELQPDGHGRLYEGLMFQNIEGAVPTTILRETIPRAIAWSPDGKRLALGTAEGKLQILDLSGRVLESISVPDAIDVVQWQPGGESIALTDYLQLYVVNANGSNLHNVPFQSPPISVSSFAWSPDGRRIAFRAVTDKSCHFAFNTSDFQQCTVESSLFTSNADGSMLKKIRGTHIDSKDSPNQESVLFWIK